MSRSRGYGTSGLFSAALDESWSNTPGPEFRDSESGPKRQARRWRVRDSPARTSRREQNEKTVLVPLNDPIPGSKPMRIQVDGRVALRES